MVPDAKQFTADITASNAPPVSAVQTNIIPITATVVTAAIHNFQPVLKCPVGSNIIIGLLPHYEYKLYSPSAITAAESALINLPIEGS